MRFGDTDVAKLGRRGLKDLRSEVQMVFQDPYAALNPAAHVEYILSRPIATTPDSADAMPGAGCSRSSRPWA